MTCIQHVLFCTFFALKMLATYNAMSILNLFSYKSCELLNISTLISKWWEIMSLKHVLLWIRSWTEQTLVFILFLLSNDWEFRARWSLTSFINLWGFAWVISQFFTIIFVFLWIEMLFVCLRGKELFGAQLAVKFILSTTFGA